MYISKKDLLNETGISYGQLYRWKRENLIPEEWFIKQPSFTGQETFFPKTKILSRIKAIQQLKDQYSLEEMAKILSPEISERFFTANDLKIIDEIDAGLIPAFCKTFGKDRFLYIEVLTLIALTKCKNEFFLQLVDIEKLCRGLSESLLNIKKTDFIFILLSHDGEFYGALHSEPAQVYFDNRLKKLTALNISDISSKFKIKYRKSFNFKFDNEEVIPFDNKSGKVVLT